MPSHSYVIGRLGVASLARWGFAVGALVACLPGFVCSTIFFSITAAAYHTIESWRDVGLTIGGDRHSLDLIRLLQLGAFINAMRGIQAFGIFGILLLALLFAFALGLIVSLSFALAGIFYNFTGRLEIELAEE